MPQTEAVPHGTDGGTTGGETALARLFGLSEAEGRLAEEVCTEVLAERGIAAGRFFDALRGGARFDAALGLTPEICEAIYARAHRWFAVGRPERAEPLFRALCVADGQVADYWVGLGICLRLADRLNEARMAFETAIRLRPGWAVAAFHLAELSLRLNDAPAAGRHLAAFRAGADAATPAQMTAEAARLEQALRLRQR